MVNRNDISHFIFLQLIGKPVELLFSFLLALVVLSVKVKRVYTDKGKLWIEINFIRAAFKESPSEFLIIICNNDWMIKLWLKPLFP